MPEAPLAVNVTGAKALSQSVLVLAVTDVGLAGGGVTHDVQVIVVVPQSVAVPQAEFVL